MGKISFPGNNDDGWNILLVVGSFLFGISPIFMGELLVSRRVLQTVANSTFIHPGRWIHMEAVSGIAFWKRRNIDRKNRQHLQGCMVSLDLLVWWLNSKTITLNNHKSSLPSKGNTYLILE